MPSPDYTPDYFADFIDSSVDYTEVDSQIVGIDYPSYPFMQLLNKLGQKRTLSTTFDWAYESPEVESVTIASFDTDGDGTGINVGDTTGLFPGDLLQAVGSARESEQIRIDSVDDSTDLTVVRDANGTTGVTYEVGDELFLVGKQHEEGGMPSREYYVPNHLDNYVYCNSALVTRSLIRLAQKHRYNEFDWENDKATINFKRDWERQYFWGEPHEATSSAPYWASRGLYSWVDWANSNDDLGIEHIHEIAEASWGRPKWKELCRSFRKYGRSRLKFMFLGEMLYEKVYDLFEDKHRIINNNFLEYDISTVPTYNGYRIALVEHPMLANDQMENWGFVVDPLYVFERTLIPFISWTVDFTKQATTQKGLMLYGVKGLQVKNPFTLHLVKIV